MKRPRYINEVSGFYITTERRTIIYQPIYEREEDPELGEIIGQVVGLALLGGMVFMFRGIAALIERRSRYGQHPSSLGYDYNKSFV
jgi:hypothetical protein